MFTSPYFILHHGLLLDIIDCGLFHSRKDVNKFRIDICVYSSVKGLCGLNVLGILMRHYI